MGVFKMLGSTARQSIRNGFQGFGRRAASVSNSSAVGLQSSFSKTSQSPTSLHKTNEPWILTKIREDHSLKTSSNCACVQLVARRGLRTTARLNEEKIVECPAFAESISEGDLRWEKAVGDVVNADDVICEIETDKTSVPVPAPCSGTITELLVEDDATVSPGTQLAKIKAGAAGAAKPKAEAPKAAEPVAAAAPTPPPPAP